MGGFNGSSVENKAIFSFEDSLKKSPDKSFVVVVGFVVVVVVEVVESTSEVAV